MKLKCKRCDIVFTRKDTRQKYCCSECRIKACTDEWNNALKAKRLKDKAISRTKTNIAHIMPYSEDKVVLVRDLVLYTDLVKDMLSKRIVKQIKIHNGRGLNIYNTIKINDFIIYLNTLIDGFNESLNMATKTMLLRIINRLDYVYEFSVIPESKPKILRQIPNWAITQADIRNDLKINCKRLTKLVWFGYLKKVGCYITKDSFYRFKENHLEILNLRSNYWKMQ